jgi:hypothetical protein
MTKATAVKPIGDNVPLFKDPETGGYHTVGKIPPKEADGKRPGPHEVPASAENLNKLIGKFAK